MTTWISAILLFFVITASIPVVVLFVQVLSALPYRKGKRRAKPACVGEARPRLAVLVPAHNEAAGIAKTLANIAEQLCDNDRLVVVADNCTDDTAAVARAAGAEVVVRNDLKLRGKGYALDFGVRFLKDDPPEIVVVVDADCFLKDAALDRLAETVVATGRPTQALYRMLSPDSGRVNRQLAEFAWIIKNKVRPLGFWRLGLPCQLMGTGMAFPWSAIERAPLASGHIVEDLKLGLDLARKGLPPVFCPEAEVISYFPSSDEGAESQRTRWVHGHLGLMASEAPVLLATGLASGNVGLLALALDLCVLPLSLLVLAVTALAAVCLLSVWVGGTPPGIVSAAFALDSALALALVLCWWRFGRHLFAIDKLPAGICYIFERIPLFYQFIFARQVDWIRSKRDPE